MSKRAVIVGVNYQGHPKLPPLKGAENDACEFADRLRAGGFDDVALLTGTKGNATYLNIREALSQLLYSDEQRDLALFYFSGHGLEDKFGDGYIAPCDFDYANPWVKGFGMKDLKDLLLGTANKNAGVAILDCCYSGIATKGDKAGSSKPADLTKQFEGGMTGEGRVIITSSGADETSRECFEKHSITGEGPHDHGVFTHYLLDALDGGAAEDMQEGKVSLAALYNYAQDNILTEPRPRKYESNADDLRKIVILNASQARRLKPRIDDIRAELLAGESSALYTACSSLADLLKIAPGLDEVCKIRTETEQRIDDLKDLLDSFLTEHYAEILRNKAQPDVLSSRRALVAGLSFHRFVEIDGPSLVYLEDLCKAARQKIPVAEYSASLKEKKLKEAPAPSSSQLASSQLALGATAGGGGNPE